MRKPVLMASNPAAHDLKRQTSIPMSGDVTEALMMARKAAAKAGSPYSDRHLLQAVLKLDRLFNRLDRALKSTGSSPKALKKAWNRLSPLDNPGYPHPSTALDRATELARDSVAQGGETRIEIEDLLTGLAESPDPMLQTLFAEAGLKREALAHARPRLRQDSPVRVALYATRELLEVILVVLVLVIVIKQGLFEFRLIPSESMVPTLKIGDRILVEKPTGWFRKPHRGDILVFYPPNGQSVLQHDPWSTFLRLTGFSGLIYPQDSKLDRAFIKRVVGLPGETIDVRPGEGVFIDGKKLTEPYVNEVGRNCTYDYLCGPMKIPAKSYFMMGDNRNRSADSRVWGVLPANRVIGRAVFRFFPFDKRLGPLTAQPPVPVDLPLSQ